MPDDAKPGTLDRLRSRLDLSLAAIVTASVGVFLLVLALMAWLIYSLDPTRIAWGDYMTPWRGVVLFALWSLTCAMTYLTVRLWMSDSPPGDLRVRDGWNAGKSLLTRHGLSLSDLPCFIVLGCETRHEQDALLGPDGFSTGPSSSNNVPAIDWHVTEERILIFCRDIGVYGGLLRAANADISKVESNVDDTDFNVIGSHNEPDDSEANAGSELPHVRDVSHTNEKDATQGADRKPHDTQQNDPLSPVGESSVAVAQQVAEAKPVASKTAKAMSVAGSPATVNHAMETLNRASSLVEDAQAIRPKTIPARAIPESLSSKKTTECQEQMSQLCARLRAERFPHAAINGTLVIVGAETLGTSDSHSDAGRALGRAIRSDLDQMQAELGVVTPVAMMVADQGHSDDYGELHRRLRILDKCDPGPLGKTFVPEEVPTTEAMNELANATVHTIESRVQSIFQLTGSLRQPQNHRLIRILIQCRRWRSLLRSLLVESSAVDLAAHHRSKLTDTKIVSGLFVASASSLSAHGQTRKGFFFDPVVRHMMEQQNHLAWTEEQRHQWRTQGRVINTMIAVSILLLIALLFQIGRAASA